MGLRVWLPLIKDIKNQGVSNYQFTNSNVNFVTDGKLGTTANFNGSNGVIYTDNVSVGNTWTVCCWAKAAGVQSRYMFQLGNAATATQVQFAMRTKSEGVGQYLCICNKASWNVEASVDYRLWHHYTMRYDGTSCQVYIDGTLVSSASVSDTYSGTRLSIGNYYSGNEWNGQLQDFRLYDTVLSDSQITEIAKGLILHYPLSRSGFGCDNLLANMIANPYELGNRASVDTTEGPNVVKLVGSTADWQAVARSNRTLASMLTNYSDIRNKTVTFSAWIKANNNGKVGFTYALRNASASTRTKYYSPKTFQVTTTWKKYTFTSEVTDAKFIAGSGTISTTDYFFIECYIYNDNLTVWMRDWKLELGSTATPYIPNPNHPDYLKMHLQARENILKNSATNSPELWGTAASNGGTMNVQYNVSVPQFGCDDGIRVYGKAGSTSTIVCLITNNSHGLTVEKISVNGQKYTASIYVKNNHSSNSLTVGLNGGTAETIATGKSKRVVLTQTGNGSAHLQFNISASAASADYDFTFYHPKIEIGEGVTAWCPATTDNGYIPNNIEYDVSGFGYNGTVKNIISYSGDTSCYGVSTVFNGVDSTVTRPFSMGNMWSVGCWAKLNGVKQGFIFQLGTSYSYGATQFGIHTTATNGTFYVICNGSSSKKTTSVDCTTWVHYFLTYDGSSLKTYFNGELFDTVSITNSIVNGTKLSIGSYYDYNNWFDGLISDFRIYSTVLSEDDIQALYQKSNLVSN